MLLSSLQQLLEMSASCPLPVRALRRLRHPSIASSMTLMVHAVPNVQQTLLQFVNAVHSHMHTDISSSCGLGLTVLFVVLCVYFAFSQGQFTCVMVSYSGFSVFPVCYCLAVSTITIDCWKDSSPQ